VTRAIMVTTLGLAAVLASAGCGGARVGLAHDFPDDRAEHVRDVLARVAAAGPRTDPAIVVGLTPAPMRIWAFDLEARQLLWEHETAPSSTPHVAGRFVITEEGSELVIRRIEDGAVAGRTAIGELHLQGADGEGPYAAIALSTGGGVGARSRLVLARGGSTLWSLEMDQAIGEPAVRAGMVFLPWGQQNLSVLDAERQGAELARVRSTRGVIGHAIAQDRGVFFGQRGIALLGESASSPDAAPWLEPIERDLPGDPGMMRNAYEPPPGPTSASHRVRLVWRAQPDVEGQHARLLDDTLYLVFYRLVFALEATEDRVRWVAQLPADIVGATAEDGGVLLVDEQGRLSALSRQDGRITWIAESGRPATWAHVSHATYQGGTAEGDAVPLRDQLLAATPNTDARLVPARAYAARLLASLPEPEVTASLVSLCDDRNLPAQLHGAACDALAERSVGTEHVIDALGRHASYLDGTTAPPVGALARAAVRGNARNAVPLLVAHLRDPQTAIDDVGPLAEALGALADRAAVDPLDDFIRLYHAESPDPGLAGALGSAITAYTALAGPSSQETLRVVIDDPMSMPAAREAAREALAALERGAQPAGGEGTGEAEREAATTGETPEDAPVATARPRNITAAILAEVLAPIDGDLDACLATPNQVHGQARVVLVIEPDGALSAVSVNPAVLQPCLEPLVRTRTFPATTQRARQTITYTVRR
jgi:hypothetical protein